MKEKHLSCSEYLCLRFILIKDFSANCLRYFNNNQSEIPLPSDGRQRNIGPNNNLIAHSIFLHYIFSQYHSQSHLLQSSSLAFCDIEKHSVNNWKSVLLKICSMHIIYQSLAIINDGFISLQIFYFVSFVFYHSCFSCFLDFVHRVLSLLGIWGVFFLNKAIYIEIEISLLTKSGPQEGIYK